MKRRLLATFWIATGVAATAPTPAHQRQLGPAAASVPAAPVCKGLAGHAEVFGSRRTFLLRPDWMATIKSRGANDRGLAAAWKSVFM